MAAIMTQSALPLISFNSIIDMDMAVIKYILLDYPEKDLFNIKKISDKSYIELLSDIYKRKYKNPLYYFLKGDNQKGRFDEIYQTLVSEKEKDILKYAVATEMYNLLLKFVKEPEISPEILYFTENQKEYLENETNLQDIPKVSLKEALNKRYSIYYLDKVEEGNTFFDKKNTVFYFSTRGVNLDDKNEDIVLDESIISKLYKQQECKIAIYELYPRDIIGGYLEND